MKAHFSYFLGFVVFVYMLVITTITNPHPSVSTLSTVTTVYGWPSPWLVIVTSYAPVATESGFAPGDPVSSFGGIRWSQFVLSALAALAFGVAASLPPIIRARLRRTVADKDATGATEGGTSTGDGDRRGGRPFSWGRPSCAAPALCVSVPPPGLVLPSAWRYWTASAWPD